MIINLLWHFDNREAVAIQTGIAIVSRTAARRRGWRVGRRIFYYFAVVIIIRRNQDFAIQGSAWIALRLTIAAWSAAGHSQQDQSLLLAVASFTVSFIQFQFQMDVGW